MSDENPTLQDIWRLLGTMNRRFDTLEHEIVVIKTDMALFKAELTNLRAEMHTGFGALKASIEARDFRLDEQGRRISELERSRG
jgi:hypothetical protein